ncbi:M28 family peptidase [Urbifossiella limnaea]|uniref:Alkaline phosphatase isozyme conversion aminopeptidase n=1 Tax=Urbifossiella limnaea TaxID=2528023 RepID=A0A517XYQ9_9BACT|nr:M28 family peptidase [Urbifossiella limnaea]QDU22598.1 alkaline phosphatase isozyme conversion aminopeptidase [Urbifossiella limnaea]
MNRPTGAVLAGLVAAAGLAAGCSAGAQSPTKKSGFAEDAVPKAIPAVEFPFDQTRAVGYVKQLCDIGPRVSGTDGMAKQIELVEKHFKAHGATVTRQEFKARQASKREPTNFTNLIVSWHPEKAKRVLFCAHYDTRPIADQEPDRASWNRPFVSANDGAGGLALFMELAHHMKGVKSEVGIDFVLFDGEEYVFEPRQFGGSDRYFFGSDHFADEYQRTRDTRKHAYAGGVLLDLATAKGAVLRVEGNSWALAPDLVKQVWAVAGAVNAKSFRAEPGHEVQDDHLALNRVGIPCVDVIDFDYPHWHKLTDTPDKISGEQMAEVAKVLVSWAGIVR